LHENLAEFFSERTEVADEHSHIVSALTPLGWPTAPAYTRRYLALHAAAASRLDELLESPAFLVAAEPDTLRRVVAQGKSDYAVRNGGVYSVAAHLLGPDLGERAANLALAAMKFGYRDLAEEFRNFGSGSKWWIRATQWKRLSPHFVIRTEHGSVRAVAVGQRDGVAVIASGGDDSRIRLWNLETLQPVGKPLELGKESIRVEGLAIEGSTLLTVTDGSLDAWDIDTLESAQCRWSDRRVLALSTPAGRCLAISDDDSLLEVRKVPEGELVMPAFPLGPISLYSHYAIGERAGGLLFLSGIKVFDLATMKEVGSLSEPSFNAIGTGLYNGRPAIVTGTSEGDVRIWDSESLLPVAGPLQGHETYVDTVALGERKGQSIAVSGSRDGTVRVWNPARPTREKSVNVAHTSAVWALALGKNIVVSCSWDRSIRVWNMETLEPVGDPIPVQSSAVAVGELRGHPVIFLGGEKGVSLWDVETRNAIGVGFGNPVRALALGTRKGRPVVLGGSNDALIRAWDAETFKPVGNPLKAFPSNMSMGVNGLAVYGEAGQQYILSAGSAAAIQAWDLETLQPAGPAMKGHESVIYALAQGVLHGKPLVATVSFDETVRVWDLEAFQQIGAPLRGHESHVYAVAIAEWNGLPVIFSGGRDGTLRVWDLETHAPISVIRLDSWIYSLQTRGNLVFAGCANGLAAIELR
jgi:WD40 repeat protein